MRAAGIDRPIKTVIIGKRNIICRLIIAIGSACPAVVFGFGGIIISDKTICDNPAKIGKTHGSALARSRPNIKLLIVTVWGINEYNSAGLTAVRPLRKTWYKTINSGSWIKRGRHEPKGDSPSSL